MNKEYIVGIDFGHGETAVWIVPLVSGSGFKSDGDAIHFFGVGNEKDDKPKWSQCFPYQSEDHSWKVGLNKNGFPVSYMKNDPKLINFYRGFIAAVCRGILQQNSCLQVSQDDRNFYLCVACPTKWSQEQKLEYEDFINNAVSYCGLSVDAILNESDAAFFANINLTKGARTSLVIDYGSSTIDYTIIHDGKKEPHDDWSNEKLGASNIENDLFYTYCKLDPKYDDKHNLVEKYIKENHISDAFFLMKKQSMDPIKDSIICEFRKLKEAAYKGQTNVIDFNFTFKKMFDCKPLKEYVFAADDLDIDQIISTPSSPGGKSYKEKVLEDFKKLADNCRKEGLFPDKIILSGGAVIMPWVKEALESVFSGASFVPDNEARFVVAKGAALYYKSYMQAVSKLEEMIKNIDSYDIYKNANRDANVSSTKKELESYLSFMRRSSSSSTGSAVKEKYLTILKSMTPENQSYSNDVCEIFNKLFSKELSIHVSRIINEIFNTNLQLKEEDIDVDIAPIILKWDSRMFQPTPDGDLSFVDKLNSWIPGNSGHTTWFYEWGTTRSSSEITNLIEAVNSDLLSFIHCNITPADPEYVRAYVKESVADNANKLASQLVNKYQLFSISFYN